MSSESCNNAMKGDGTLEVTAAVNLDYDPMLLRVSEMLCSLYSKVDETLARQEKDLEASKKKNELETKLAQELKLNSELSATLAKLSRREAEVQKVCSALESKLTIADSDRNRLDTARDMYQIAKELTGIRWDFSSPPDVIKGFVKSESRKLLSVFELRAEEAGGVGGGEGEGGAGGEGGEGSGALWAHVAAAAAPSWNLHDKENLPTN